MLKITVLGYVGSVEPIKGEGQKAVLGFSLASNSRVKTQQGYETQTTWVNCSLWGKRAESLSQYVVTGMRLYIEGEGKVTAFTKRDGSAGASLNVNVRELELLGRGNMDQQQEKTQAPQEPRFEEQSFNLDVPF